MWQSSKQLHLQYLICLSQYTVNFIYNMPPSITRTPGSDFCHNAKIYRPMYNAHPNFWPGQACIRPCIALPRSNCLDVAGVLALSVATKHCHRAPLPTHAPIGCCRQTSSGSESLTGECVAIRFHGGWLTAMQCTLSVGCSVTVRHTCSRYSL